MLLWSCGIKNADLDKYGYIGYSIGFDARLQFPLANGSCVKNVIIFGVNNSSSVPADNKKRNISVLGEGPTQGLDDTTITAEGKYSINFVLSLHYSGSNSFMFVNAAKMYQFQAQDSEIKPYPLRLGNILKNFKIDNRKKTGLKGVVKVFSINYNAIDTNDILEIHRYLMKET